MFCAKSLLAPLALVAATLSAAAATEDLPPWPPGVRSTETLVCGFDAKDLRIRPAEKLAFRGTLEAKDVCARFSNVVVTAGARTSGVNSMVYRRHEASVRTLTGAGKSDWSWIAEEEGDASGAMSIKVWARWNNPDEVAAAYKGLVRAEGQSVSPYAAAEDGYVPGVEDLLLIWDRSAFPDGAFRPGSVEVGLVNPGRRDYARRAVNGQARPLLAAGVNAECAALAALLNLPAKLPADECEVAAAALTAELSRALGGQLAFGGRLRVRRSAVTRADCARRGLARFTGVALQVVGSAGFTVSYAGGALQPAELSLEGGNRAELWYDGVEQTLRLADVRLRVPAYRGALPEARLAAFARALQGEYRGDVTFLLTYTAQQEAE